MATWRAKAFIRASLTSSWRSRRNKYCFYGQAYKTSSYFTPQTVVPVVAQTVTVGGAVVGERGNDRAHALVGVA